MPTLASAAERTAALDGHTRTEPGAHYSTDPRAGNCSTADVTPTPRVGGALFPFNDNSPSDHAERLGVGESIQNGFCSCEHGAEVNDG